MKNGKHNLFINNYPNGIHFCLMCVEATQSFYTNIKKICARALHMYMSSS